MEGFGAVGADGGGGANCWLFRPDRAKARMSASRPRGRLSELPVAATVLTSALGLDLADHANGDQRESHDHRYQCELVEGVLLVIDPVVII